MQILHDSKTIEEGARLCPYRDVRQLLAAYVERLGEYEVDDLSKLVRFIVFEHGDAVTDLDAALGFPIMTNRFDGTHFGEPDFSPSWEVAEEHSHWYELVFVLSDDGFGVVVFIPKNTQPQLLNMLQQYVR
ncbi:hypothetical protein [Pseudomonas sp.]|uniref:hypothetical protein n=1 Tax=Pseudomonas sp. TaxID=306 RepID=UPI002734A3F3|nr:hypothetical protein [Pseudomonas sp.]MDP3815786.1 hypothetical protein [Pseudomonas sp.]